MSGDTPNFFTAVLEPAARPEEAWKSPSENAPCGVSKKSKKFHFRCRRLRTGLSRSVTRSRQSILYTVCSPSYSTRMNS